MGRPKAELEARDRFARLYAAVLAAEAMVQYKNRGIERVIRIEVEDDPLWDDIFEQERSTGTCRHQVKRQRTNIPSADFRKYLQGASDGATSYHFAYPVFVDVTDVGETRVLSDLCDRVQAKGSKQDLILAALRPGERAWLTFITQTLNCDDVSALDFLTRIHIDIIGHEKELHRRGERALEQVFANAAPDAWAKIQAFVSTTDGVVEVHPVGLLKQMPPPAGDAIEKFYWSLVREAEIRFGLDRWVSLSDHLVANLFPQWLFDGMGSFVQTVMSAAWPGRYPKLEEAFRNVASRASEYIRFFGTRADSNGQIVREDTSYKRVFDPENYWNEVEAARAWDHGVQVRLSNLVVSLNKLLEAVRDTLDESYRLEGGRLGICDSMGIRGNSEARTYYPDGYRDLPPEPLQS